MNLELFIAKRLALGDKKSFSRFIIRIAVIAIALSVSVMIVSTCMVSGFSKEIKNRIFGFWGEIHIVSYDNTESFETLPIKKEQIQIEKLKQSKEVRNVAPFIIKAGILKTKTDIEGIVLKGVNKEYDWKTIDNYLKDGTNLTLKDSIASKEIMVSKSTANRLNLKVGDNIIAYFIRSDLAAPIGRKLKVVGIFHTGLEEYDKQYALVDIRLLRELNQWQENEVSGYEVRLTNMDNMDAFKDSIYYKYIDQKANAQTMKDINRNIFEWLDLQKVNEYLILGFMILVAMLNMVTALIILILDRWCRLTQVAPPAVLSKALSSGQSLTASLPSRIASVSRLGEATEPESRWSRPMTMGAFNSPDFTISLKARPARCRSPRPIQQMRAGRPWKAMRSPAMSSQRCR